MMKRSYVLVVLTLLAGLTAPRPVLLAADAPALPASVQTFLQQHCTDCHGETAPEANLDLTSLSANLHDPDDYRRWVRIVDRVQDGEMPPPDAAELTPEEMSAFLSAAGSWLRTAKTQDNAAIGRVRGRRLTNLELERTLHDLLGIDIPLANLLPEEPRSHGFTTVADGQSMSHFQLERHLAVVDRALDEAFRRATTSNDEWQRTYDAKQLARTNPRRRTREPELIKDQAVVWSGGVIFYGRLPVTEAREDGWYRFTIRASALNKPADRGVWCTVRTGQCVSSAPLLGWVGAFEATDKPQEWTFDAWLPDGHMLEIRPGDTTLKKARFQGGQIGTGEGGPQNVPGVGIHSIEMERIHQGPPDWQIRKWLFGNLDVVKSQRRKAAEVNSASPKDDAAKRMRQFAERAFRRPVSNEEVAPYIAMVQESLDREMSLINALRGGYRALLCSPRFLYFTESPGPLDDYAIASRLSYFLWQTTPDETLLRLAKSERMGDQQVLREQVDRMLADERGEQFVRDLAHQWFDLSEIDFTEPDRKLYPDFDVIVQQSMLDETHAFLQQMLDENLSIAQLIDSETTFLNSRLARYYDIDGVDGDELQPVRLAAKDHRGGLMTQGAILKVTANGTTTSPVIRGVWVADRLLGEDIPPPPESVPAIEPDIRGTKTIREMLAKHRSDASCASCHVKIDPAGFALENFDPAGQWRERYMQIDGRRRKPGATIDASYQLPDGREFADFDEFQSLILADTRSIARNAAEKLLTYGTGAPVSFADRAAIDEIVSQTEDSEYGFRSLVEAVVTSPVFLSK